jgi:hypothetical protein
MDEHMDDFPTNFDDIPPLTPEEEANWRRVEESIREDVAKHPASRDPDTAWIDADIEFVPAASWISDMHYLTIPPEDTSKLWRSRWRFHLPGGHPIDTLSITLTSEWLKLWPSYPPEWIVPEIKGITVTVNDETGFKRFYVGTILDATECCEMQQYCVTGLPRELGERVAAFVRQVWDASPLMLWRESDADDKADFLIGIRPFLADRSRCFNCGRALTDEVSKSLGVGPDCAARAGIAHTQAAAHRALQRRGA